MLVRVRLVIVVVLGMLAVLLGSSTAQAAGAKEDAGSGGEINVLDMLSKIPQLMPFLSDKFSTPACKERLAVFQREIEQGMAGARGKKTSYVPVIKRAWCTLGKKCTQDIVKSFMKLIEGGGFMESIIQAQLGDDVDIKKLDTMILAYFEMYCESVGRGDGAWRVRDGDASSDEFEEL